MRHLCFSPVWTVTSGETSDAMDWKSLLLQVFSAGLRIPLQRLHFLWPSQLLPLLLSLPCLKGNGWEERLSVNFKIRKATSRQLYSTLQHMEKVAGEQVMDLVCSSKSSSVPRVPLQWCSRGKRQNRPPACHRRDFIYIQYGKNKDCLHLITCRNWNGCHSVLHQSCVIFQTSQHVWPLLRAETWLTGRTPALVLELEIASRASEMGWERTKLELCGRLLLKVYQVLKNNIQWCQCLGACHELQGNIPHLHHPLSHNLVTFDSHNAEAY